MNLRNRLQKLEKQTDPRGFCKCKSTPKFETYTQDLTEDSESTERQPLSEPVPDKCDICRNQVDKQVFVIRLIDAESRQRFSNEFR